MKICQVLAGNEDGGLEKHTIELSKQLKHRGFEVTVIAHKDFSNFFKDVNFISLDLSKGRKNIFILYKLYSILKKHNFEIVHSQASKATSMIAKIKPFIKTSKFIATLHSFKKNIKPFEQMDFVITVSDKIAKNLKNKKQKTIYNGIKFEELKDIDNIYKKYSIPKDKFLICSVGRLCDVKRFDILIKSLKNLDVFCILVGDGENKSELKTLAKTENVENKIIFTGNIDNDDVKRIIFLSKLFVITSDKEGFPYVFIESLLVKTPIISTDVSDIKHILGEKNIIPFNNHKYLENKIFEIIDNYDGFLENFEHVFINAKANFTIENMLKETITVYRGLTK